MTIKESENNTEPLLLSYREKELVHSLLAYYSSPIQWR